MSSLEDYKAAQQAIPQMMQRWHLYGAGLENLRLETVPVPEFGPEELLVRQDACGLCFSDTKVIGLGPNHPRLTGRNMAQNPVTLGHEVACTVVGVGENLRGRFQVGQRFVIQADVFYQGVSMAYGYVLRGGLAEYSVIPKMLLDGDEGCYLLPIRPDTGYVEAALTEPWACVVSSYTQSHRDSIKNDGLLYLIGSLETHPSINWNAIFTASQKPKHIVIRDLNEAAYRPLHDTLEKNGVKHSYVRGYFGFVESFGEIRFDDILIAGDVPAGVVESAVQNMADGGIMNFVGAPKFERKLSLDIGRVHYNGHHYLGTTTDDPQDGYRETRTAELVAGGLCWIIGAGGPMGQMHVQRAVQHPNPPRRIMATDVDAARLQSITDRLGKTAAEYGVELITLNPNALGDTAFNAELARWSEGRGFDDILSMVPVAAVMEHAADYLAPGGWFHIFAGVARGTMANLDVNAIVEKRVRFFGSSGSSLADMRQTLARVERRELSANASLAAIGGLNAAAEGLKAVKEGWFSGKTLIFPCIADLPLTTLPELKEKFPTVHAHLKDGQFWTTEAEEELLRLTLT